jgi:hypothetical protein
MSTGLTGCSVDPGISCGTRKLTRTFQVIEKKKKKDFLDLSWEFVQTRE